MNRPGSHHEAGIHRTTNNPTQRVPSSVIKPIKEIVKPVLHHVRCSSIVEPTKEKPKALLAPTYHNHYHNHNHNFQTESYQGSNSWMILSNLMTEKSLDKNPVNQAIVNATKVIRLRDPIYFELTLLPPFLIPLPPEEPPFSDLSLVFSFSPPFPPAIVLLSSYRLFFCWQITQKKNFIKYSPLPDCHTHLHYF